MPTLSDAVRLAAGLAAFGWHILPLSPASKRPLGNCGACRPRHGLRAHLAHACPCLPAGGWCHGVRAGTTDPARITTWWQREPRAVPGAAAGPSALVLVDIDAHGDQLPPRLTTGLLPGPSSPSVSCPVSPSSPAWRARTAPDLVGSITKQTVPGPGKTHSHHFAGPSPSRGAKTRQVG